MEFLIIWLSTVAVSFGMEIANELRMFKDVADAGYRVDVNRLSELGKQLNPNSVNVTLLSLLMPVVNIMYVFQRAIQYNNVRPMILDQLNVIDVLKEMTELEKIEYLEKPTGLNAAFVTLKSEIPYLNPLLYGSSIEINRDDEHSKIYYKTDRKTGEIIILKAIGDASKLTVEEQKNKIEEAYKNLIRSGIESYGDAEKFTEALKNTSSMDLSNNEEVKKHNETSSQELSVSEQKELLENLKGELLERKENAQSSKIEEGKTLLKRKKQLRYCYFYFALIKLI